MKDLVDYNISILEKIDRLLHQFTDAELSRPVDLLFGSSVGQHFRHVLEFYSCLLSGTEEATFSYDRRQRDPLIEQEVIAARTCAVRNIGLLEDLRDDRELCMESELPGAGWTTQRTTLMRELAYLADHGVHHLAMIRVALEQRYPHILFPEHLGVAASTRNRRAR